MRNVTNLGTALEGFPVASADIHRGRDTLYIASFDLRPARLAAYDLGTQQVTSTTEIPNGLRPWAIGVVGDQVYLNTQHQLGDGPNLFRYDISSGDVETLGRVGDGGTKIAGAPDGKVYMGVGTVIHEYDPGDGEITEIYEYTHADVNVDVAKVTNDTIYASTTWHDPDLVAIDRSTLEEKRFLPDELADTNGIYDLRVSDDWIFASAGTEGLNALVDRHDLSDHTVVETPVDVDAYSGRAVFGDGVVYFAGIRSATIYRYDIGDDALSRLDVPLPETPTRQLLLTQDDTVLVGVDATGTVWHHDLDDDGHTTVDLVAAGAEGGPQAAQSLIATRDRVYVGANNVVGSHDLDGDGSRRIAVAGEVKAMTTVVDDVYLAMYSHGQLLRHHPTLHRPELVADWDDLQNRPRDAAHDATNGLVLVGTRSDSLGGGALVTYDIVSGEHVVHENPLGDDQAVGQVVAHDGIAYLAGRRSKDAKVAAFDPVEGEQLWSVVPVPGGGGIPGVTVARGRLFGITSDSTLFAVALADGAVVDTRTVDHGPGPMVAHRGRVYSTDGTALTRLDVDALTFEVVVDDLDEPFAVGGPHPLAANDRHLYLLSGTDLLQVSA